VRWAERPHGVRLIERRLMPPLGHFSLVRFAKPATDFPRQNRVEALASR
jgi:hypothetical protein